MSVCFVTLCSLPCAFVSRYPPAPRWELAGFERVDLEAGAHTTLTFELPARSRAEVRPTDAARWLNPSTYTVWIGGGQPQQSATRRTSNVVNATFTTTSALGVPLDSC